ncbi:MAG: glycosyltransferase family 2 protein [Alphaproteobacteria bacterium]|nr:MAG: glycosyltransferase family 2 protein [Alphaproteobacteria bacterium]
MPKVSVIIPAYNATATLERTLRSVMAQTLREWEAIVVNDASTDKTSALAHRLAKEDARIRVIDLDKNVRQSAGRNLGFDHAKGEWLAILDADDAFEPERLETLLAHAETHGLDMVADNQLFFDAGIGRVAHIAEHMPKEVMPWTLERHLTKEKIGNRFKWGLLKPLLRKAFVDGNDVRYRKQFHMGEDSLICMEMLALGAKAEVLAKPMYVYTTSRGYISGAAAGSTSRYKLDEHYATYTYFDAQYGRGLTVPESKALQGAMQASVAANEAETFKREVKKMKPAALMRALKTPQLLYFIVLGISKFLRYRLVHKLTNTLKQG